jgi:hypothetical protein
MDLFVKDAVLQLFYHARNKTLNYPQKRYELLIEKSPSESAITSNSKNENNFTGFTP